MYIKIGTTEYTEIQNLSFAPEADIIGTALPINKFSAVLVTTDHIDTGVAVSLYDDLDNLWATYWLVFAENIGGGMTEVRGESYLTLLDRIKLAPAMYSSKSVPTLIGELFNSLGSTYYSLDSSFSSETVSGYCPEQTARERLQWVLFVISAYAKTFFTDKVEILPVDDTITTIPENRTFWKPSVEYGDYVTAVKIKSYAYTAGTPANTDTWVQVGNTYYIQTEQVFTLSNSLAPASAPENVVEVDGVTLINGDNVSGIATLLSTYYFKRISVSADIINNGEQLPGDKITLHDVDGNLITGYIASCTFSFGKQARSAIKLVQTDVVEGGNLTIICLYNGMQIAVQRYTLPVGYSYQIENPFVDSTIGMVRRIYRPVEEYATGTVASSGTVDEEQYAIALEHKDQILTIYSVDDFTVSEQGVVSIA